MNPHLKVFITGNHPWVRQTLAEDGFAVLDESDLLPGQNQSQALQSAEVVLLVWIEGESDDWGGEGVPEVEPTGFELSAWRRSKSVYGVPIIFGYISPDRIPDSIAELKSIVLKRPDGKSQTEIHNRSVLLPALRRLASKLKGLNPGPNYRQKASVTSLPLKLEHVELVNVGCFQYLDLALDRDWTTILGDNAAGKSTLLRSLALGLCTESEAAALIKDLPGLLRRHGASLGEISLKLKDPETGKAFSIRTTIEEGPAGDEIVRKATLPEEFPWDRLFVCAYGTNRSRRATESHEEYSTRAAVRTLFDDSLPLHNSEVVLLRQENGLRRTLETRMLKILMLDEARFEYTGGGPVIHGSWGDQPIRSLSDGYRSTLQWAIDFCAWAIHAGRFGEEGVAGGILLIDELEQHLHPRWQRHIVKELRQQFTSTQIVVTTHTPLITAGVADLESGQVVRLLERDDGVIDSVPIRPQELWGQRADQILTSEAFGLITSSNVGSEKDLDRYSELLGKSPRSETEEAKFQELRVRLREHFSLGQTKTEQEAEIIVQKVLDELNSNLSKEKIGFEARQLLQDILRPRSE